MNGKTSKPRPYSIPLVEYGKRYDEIFFFISIKTLPVLVRTVPLNRVETPDEVAKREQHQRVGSHMSSQLAAGNSNLWPSLMTTTNRNGT